MVYRWYHFLFVEFKQGTREYIVTVINPAGADGVLHPGPRR
jgi:hypothetical protein